MPGIERPAACRPVTSGRGVGNAHLQNASNSARVSAPHPAVFSDRASIANGRAALARLLDEEGFTKGAIFCSSDLLAHGVLIEAQARSIVVPGEIAVVGFGDQDFAANIVPALTTVRVDGDRLGTAAARAVLARVRCETELTNVIDIGFELVRRASA